MSENRLTHAIQDEPLLSINFDPTNVMNVMNEMVVLFKDMRNRIVMLETQIRDSAKQEAVISVQEKLSKFRKETADDFRTLQSQVESNYKDSVDSVNELREWTENEKLGTIGEARRLITAEISNIPSIDPVKQKLDEVETRVNKLTSEFDSLTIPTISAATTDPEQFAGLRIAQMEKRISDIEHRLLSYPQVEADISTIMLQYPANNKRIDKKLNDIMEVVQTKMAIASNTPQPIIMNPIEHPPPPIREEEREPPKPVTRTETIYITRRIPAASPAKGETPKKEEPEDVDFEPIKIDVPQVTKTEVMEPLKPPSPIRIQTEAEKLVQNLIASKGSFAGEGGDKHTSVCNDGSVVNVIEKKTYVTEMNPSVRVVTELEWLRTMIQQHHEAIRKVQQNMKTEEENMASVTENIVRIGSTTNQRLAQIAQQQLRIQQEHEEHRKLFIDQMNEIRQRIGVMAIDSGRFVEMPVHVSSTRGEKHSPKTSPPKSIGPKLSLKKALPNLNDPSPIESPVHDDTARKSERNSVDVKSEEQTSARRYPNERDKKDQTEQSGEPRRTKPKLVFTMTHFNTGQRGVMTSEFRTHNDEPNIVHFDLFTNYGSGIPPPITIGQTDKTKITVAERVDRIHDDELSPQSRAIYQDVQPEVAPQRAPTVSEIIQIGRLPQKPMIQNLDFDQVSEEMIEEKVGIIARRVVTLLADNAKKDLDKQAQEVQKIVDQMVTKVEGKIDRDFVERMFNKFRVVISEMNEKIDNVQCSFLEWVTRDELELVLQKFLGVVSDVKDAAATKTKYNCLLCGKPRQHLAGMMINSTPTQEAPTRPVKRYAEPDYLQNEIPERGKAQPRDIVQFLTS